MTTPHILFFLSFLGFSKAQNESLRHFFVTFFAPDCLNMRKIVYFYEKSLDIDFLSQYII